MTIQEAIKSGKEFRAVGSWAWRFIDGDGVVRFDFVNEKPVAQFMENEIIGEWETKP